MYTHLYLLRFQVITNSECYSLPQSSSYNGINSLLYRLKHLHASFRLLISTIVPSTQQLDSQALEAYSRPPYPPFNPYVAYPEDANVHNRPKPAKSIAFSKLLPHLVSARREAMIGLIALLKKGETIDQNGMEGKSWEKILKQGSKLANEAGLQW